MKREHRIRKRRDFLKAASVGIYFKSNFLITQLVHNESGCVRVGFTVSKRVGNAVMRNKIKRRLRAAAAIIMNEGGFLDMDYVFVARKFICSIKWDVLLDVVRSSVAFLNKKSQKCKN